MVDYNQFQGNDLTMPEKKEAKLVQRNLSYEEGVLSEFEAYCKSRGASKGYIASAAILQFLRMKADDRDRALVDLDEWISGGEGAKRIRGELEPGK